MSPRAPLRRAKTSSKTKAVALEADGDGDDDGVAGSSDEDDKPGRLRVNLPVVACRTGVVVLKRTGAVVDRQMKEKTTPVLLIATASRSQFMTRLLLVSPLLMVRALL